MAAAALPDRPTAWPRRLALLGVLAALLLGNWFVRRHLEHWHHHSYFVLSGAPLELLEQQPWRVLLPIPIGNGQSWWVTTSLVVVELMHHCFTPNTTFLLLNALVVLVSFGTSWLAFRSWVFTVTFTLCMAFGTQLHYAYALSGTFVLYLQIVYLELCLLCMQRLLTLREKTGRWKVGFVASLVALVIGFDTWYNVLAFLWVGGVLLWIYYRRRGETERLPALRFMLLVATLCAAVHLPVKFACYAGQHFTPGREDELLLTYHHRTLMAEDFVSNVLTYTYISLTNFLPPFLISSNSAYRLGTAEIVREQFGYDPAHTQLVAMHHLFLWYFYAGIVFALYAFFLTRAVVRAVRDREPGQLYLALILLGVGAGAGTHLLIKYRPYMSVPSLSYKCMPSILATAVLLSYLLVKARVRIRRGWVYGACVCLVWVGIVYGGLSRPRMLSYLNTQVGLGTYPDPLEKLRHWRSW